jgi:hypothetical protein
VPSMAEDHGSGRIAPYGGEAMEDREIMQYSANAGVAQWVPGCAIPHLVPDTSAIAACYPAAVRTSSGATAGRRISSHSAEITADISAKAASA